MLDEDKCLQNLRQSGIDLAQILDPLHKEKHQTEDEQLGNISRGKKSKKMYNLPNQIL